MSFHLYQINELYSNADGSIQFIEMTVGSNNGENFWSGHSITVGQGGTSHSFVFPADLPSQLTANTKVLIATQGFANLGIVSPDYIVPANFLFTDGGTVNYAGVDFLNYAQLPTDGATSVNRNGATAMPSPTNFGGDTAALSLISGGAGNDILHTRAGNDVIEGGGGVDTVEFSGNRINYMLTISASSDSVMDHVGSDGTDTLFNVERLQFTDAKLALDLDGNAGTTVKILGAVFGAASVANKEYVGIGLSLLDGGMPYETLMQFALDAAGATTHAAEVNLLWTNLFGSPPTAEQAGPYVALLDSGALSSGALGVIAADSDLNKVNINLVGLQQTGIEYS